MSDLSPGLDRWRGEIRRRLEPLSLQHIREAEIVEEIAQHLDDRYRELKAAGHAPDAAAVIAWRELEDDDALGREIAHIETRAPLDLPPPGAPARGRWLSAFWLDLRYAARTLRTSPGFTFTVLFAVALSIGPTTAILSIGNWLLWRPHPGVTDSSRLAEVWTGRWMKDANGLSPTWLTYDDLKIISERSVTTIGLAGGQELSASLSVHGQLPRTAGTAHVTANFFDVLGVKMRAGRAFLPEEDRLPGTPVAIISEGVAASAFGAADEALGKSISLNSRPFSVVGVTAAEFGGTSPMAEAEVWVPGAVIGYLDHSPKARPPVFYSFVARMAPDADATTVEGELSDLIRSLTDVDAERKDRLEGVEARAFPGLGVFPLMRASTRTTVRTMLWIGLALLLIGCANIANLLVLRTTRRSHEIGIRKALGATAARLVQAQLMEACLLATSGAVMGLILAVLLKELIQTLMFPEPAGVTFAVPLDWRVLAATAVAALATGLLAAAAPAWLAARGAVLRPGMGACSRGSTRARSLRGALAALQLALSLMLLVGALLLVTTLRNLRAIDLGFDPDGITLLPVDLSDHGYSAERQLQYFRAVLPALQAHGEFEAVTLAERAPFGSGAHARVEPPGGSEPIAVGTNGITEGYFDVLRTPMLRGRTLTAAESLASPAGNFPVVINETLARRLFGSSDAVGRTVRIPASRMNPALDLPVVGVAQDTLWNDVTGAAEPFLYYPLGSYYRFGRGTFIVKSSLPAWRVEEIAGEIAARVDRNVPFRLPGLLTADIDRQLADQRLFAWVLSLLAALGFLLASFGLYGLVAQTVAERAREFGIRIALGAGRGDIVRLVARYALVVSSAGIIMGVGLAAGGTRLLQSMLHGVTRLDPGIYAAAAVTLITAVALACVAPVLRALRVQPVEVLRAE